MDRDTDTDGYRYKWMDNFTWNSRFDGWIDCIHSTIQIDKLFTFIWNSKFDGWIDCIHDTTTQMDTDTDTIQMDKFHLKLQI